MAGTHASVYALRLLRTPVFTHLDTNERRRNAASRQSGVAQSDRNGVPLEPSYAFLCSLALLVSSMIDQGARS